MNAEEITDEALVKDYNENKNQEAFLTIYERYERRIAAAILSQLAGFRMAFHDIDDIIQGVFFDLHNRGDQFDPSLPSSTVRAFLFKQADRRTRNYRRRCHAQRRDTRRLRRGSWFEAACNDPQLCRESEVRTVALIQEMVTSLPDDEREVIRLTWLEGHTYSSAANLLKLPLTTVECRARAALEHLRKRFAA